MLIKSMEHKIKLIYAIFTIAIFVEVGSSRSSTMRLPGPFIEYLMGCLMSGLIALILVFPLILSGG